MWRFVPGMPKKSFTCVAFTVVKIAIRGGSTTIASTDSVASGNDVKNARDASSIALRPRSVA